MSTESIRTCSIVFPFNPKFEIRNPKSFDHLVRPRQHVGRNRHADLLGRLQINDELELRRLLDREVGGLVIYSFIDDKTPPW